DAAGTLARRERAADVTDPVAVLGRDRVDDRHRNLRPRRAVQVRVPVPQRRVARADAGDVKGQGHGASGYSQRAQLASRQARRLGAGVTYGAGRDGGRTGMYKASQEAADHYAADVAAAAERGKLLDAARAADTALREAEARRAPVTE